MSHYFIQLEPTIRIFKLPQLSVKKCASNRKTPPLGANGFQNLQLLKPTLPINQRCARSYEVMDQNPSEEFKSVEGTT